MCSFCTQDETKTNRVTKTHYIQLVSFPLCSQPECTWENSGHFPCPLAYKRSSAWWDPYITFRHRCWPFTWHEISLRWSSLASSSTNFSTSPFYPYTMQKCKKTHLLVKINSFWEPQPKPTQEINSENWKECMKQATLLKRVKTKIIIMSVLRQWLQDQLHVLPDSSLGKNSNRLLKINTHIPLWTSCHNWFQLKCSCAHGALAPHDHLCHEQTATVSVLSWVQTAPASLLEVGHEAHHKFWRQDLPTAWL